MSQCNRNTVEVVGTRADSARIKLGTMSTVNTNRSMTYSRIDLCELLRAQLRIFDSRPKARDELGDALDGVVGALESVGI